MRGIDYVYCIIVYIIFITLRLSSKVYDINIGILGISHY